MTYEEFRQKIANEVKQSKEDKIILDIFLTDKTLNVLMEEGKKFYSYEGYLTIVLPEDNVITISKLNDYFEHEGIFAYWRICLFDDYTYYTYTISQEKRVYIL